MGVDCRIALRQSEVAESLGVCERTVRKWMQEEGLPFVRIGGALLFPVHLLRTWVDQRVESMKPLPDVVEEIIRSFE